MLFCKSVKSLGLQWSHVKWQDLVEYTHIFVDFIGTLQKCVFIYMHYIFELSFCMI